MLEIEAIHQHRRALTAGALYLLSATEGPIPADPLITAVAADIDALLARVSALEAALRETIPLLAYAQDLADEAYKPALGTKYYQLRQQIAALFPPPD